MRPTEGERSRLMTSISAGPKGGRLQAVDLRVEKLVGHGELADLGLQPANLDVAAVGRPGLERGFTRGQQRVPPSRDFGRRDPESVEPDDSTSGTADAASPDTAE